MKQFKSNSTETSRLISLFSLVSVVALTFSGCITSKPRTQFREPLLSLVCNGSPAEGTGSYSGDKPHSIVIAYASGRNEPLWNEKTPDEWYPDSLSELQLVACVENVRETLEVCQYIGPSITRYRWKSFIWVVEAATGETIEFDTFYGAEPRHCMPTETRELTELSGEEVKFEQISGWLQKIVEAQLSDSEN